MNNTKHLKVNSREQAWVEVDKIFPTDYYQDVNATSRAGYPVYYSTGSNFSWIDDLSVRIEVNVVGKDGKCQTTMVWIEDQSENVRKQLAARTSELYPSK